MHARCYWKTSKREREREGERAVVVAVAKIKSMTRKKTQISVLRYYIEENLLGKHQAR